MRPDLRIVLNLLVLCLTMTVEGMSVPVAWAQDDSSSNEADLKETAEEEPVAAISGAGRILLRDRAIALDQAKLEEVRLELEKRQSFFNRLGRQTQDLAVALEEKRKQREELGEAAGPEEISALEAEIAELETQVGFMTVQTDLTLTAENTVREQLAALEKKLERERRSIDSLRGLAPVTPATSGEVVSPASAAEPALPSTQLPGMPGIPIAAPMPGSEPATTRLKSTAQIEAVREVERLAAEVTRTEQEVIEFVKRKESLQQQIDFEKVLRTTAESSVENLSQALEAFEGLLQAKTVEGASEAEIRYHQEGVDTIEELISESEDEVQRRIQYIESLQERMNRMRVEEDLVTQEVEDRRKDAKRAVEKLYWLESPLHPKTLWRWLSTRGPRMLLVIVVAWVLLAMVRWSARRVAKTVVGTGDKERARGTNRADTLALSFRSALSLVIVMGAVLLVFQEAGVDLKTVLGGAAILGVAFAFGAQNLMRDYFTGFMILLEDQYELGDLITIGGITGTVERVNMRTTMLRDIEGRVHFIPNGEIKSVTNRTYVWGRAVLEIPISYKEDVDRVMEVIQQVAEEFRQDPEVGDWVTDVPVMLGVDKFTESGVVIKFMVQTKPDKIFPTRRQLLRRIKKRFDAEGIEISVPHRVLIQETSEDARV